MVSVVRRYYLYRVTLSSGFYLPVSVIYMEARGLGLAQIGLVQGLFLFAMVTAELPTGYLGDRLGRRTALALGNGLTASVMAGFVLADSVLDFSVLYVVWAVAWTFRSGTADAWFFELLASRADDDEFARLSGRAEAVSLGVSAAAAISAGVLYTVSPWIPFGANAGLAALGLPVLFGMPRTKKSSSDEPTMTVRRAAGVLREQFTRPALRWLVLYAALFNIVFSVTRVFEQPALTTIGVPVAGLGVLYAGFKLVSAAASSAAGPLQDWLGTRGVLLALIPIFGVVYTSFSLVPLLLVPAVFMRRAVEQVVRPVRNEYVNSNIEDMGRATVLSGVSMALSTASGTANVIGGHVAHSVGPVRFLSVTGVAVAVVAGGLWLLTSPVRDGGSGREVGTRVAGEPVSQE
jgi:MFS family permease